MATGSAKPHAQQRKITEPFGFKKARLNHQRDNMQEAPAPTIHPRELMPAGIIDATQAVPLQQQGPAWQR
jgi:hypothetical protein